MDKLKSLLHKCLESARQFPVELLLGVTFFVLYVVYFQLPKDSNQSVADVLVFFFPLFVLTYVCHLWSTESKCQWMKIIYWLSYLVYIPLLFMNIKQFVDSYAFGFTCLLAVFALFVGKHKLDNKPFASECLHTSVNLFLAALLGGMVIAAFAAIWLSFSYIFGIEETSRPLQYCVLFTLFIIIPMLFANFNNRSRDPQWEQSKVIHWVLDFILSPSIIIYTVILYIYFIQITCQWELPKGGVAYMVMAFVIVSLLGILLQNLLQKHYYNWFYQYFTWYALPPLVLFWIGTVYRISLYSLTESRVYLLIAGVLMTLFIFFLLFKRVCNYRSMLLISCAAIIVFTFIPGISAHHIGIYAQTKRLESCIKKLHLLDEKTHKLIVNNHYDYKALAKDSIKGDQLAEVSDIYSYLSQTKGKTAIKEMYGEWKFDADKYQMNRETDKTRITITQKTPVDVSQYPFLYPDDDYSVNEEKGQILVKATDSSKILMTYPVTNMLKDHPEMINESSVHPEQVLTFRNDSLLLVLDRITIEKKDGSYKISNIYNNKLFSRGKK